MSGVTNNLITTPVEATVAGLSLGGAITGAVLIATSGPVGAIVALAIATLAGLAYLFKSWYDRRQEEDSASQQQSTLQQRKEQEPPLPTKRALVVIDMQNDFMEGGSLPVEGAKALIPTINKLMKSNFFSTIVATQDWHPVNHCSFEDQGGPFPSHCIALPPEALSGNGADFAEGLAKSEIQHSFKKGNASEAEAFSAFYDVKGNVSTNIAKYLRKKQVTDLYLVGVATDYCVHANALHALQEGFKVHVIRDAVAGIKKFDSTKALIEIQKAGGKVIDAEVILNPPEQGQE